MTKMDLLQKAKCTFKLYHTDAVLTRSKYCIHIATAKPALSNQVKFQPIKYIRFVRLTN